MGCQCTTTDINTNLLPKFAPIPKQTLVASSISSKQAHSIGEWILCCPEERLGVGNPISVNPEPSVPPRIIVFFTSNPKRSWALIAKSTTRGSFFNPSARFRYCFVISRVILLPGVLDSTSAQTFFQLLGEHSKLGRIETP